MASWMKEMLILPTMIADVKWMRVCISASAAVRGVAPGHSAPIGPKNHHIGSELISSVSCIV